MNDIRILNRFVVSGENNGPNSMSDRLHRLAQRISDELNDLERVVGRVQEGWHRMTEEEREAFTDDLVYEEGGEYYG